MYRLEIVLEHLSGLFTAAHLLQTLSLQIISHHQLKVPAVVEECARQEGGGRLLVQQHRLPWTRETLVLVPRRDKSLTKADVLDRNIWQFRRDLTEYCKGHGFVYQQAGRILWLICFNSRIYSGELWWWWYNCLNRWEQNLQKWKKQMDYLNAQKKI